jgi:hypothetical protein
VIPLKARTVADVEVQKALDEINSGWNTARAAAVFHNGVLREDVALSGTALAVYHGLGRVPKYVAAVKTSGHPVAVVVEPHPDAKNYVFVKAAPRTPRQLSTSISSIGNVGAGEDDLHTFTVPGGTLAVGRDAIEAEYSFFLNANANNKRVRVRWDGALLYDSTAQPVNNGALVIRCRITRATTSTTSQRTWTMANSTGAAYTPAATADTTANINNDLILKVTGEATNNDDIFCLSSSVRLMPSERPYEVPCNLLIA